MNESLKNEIDNVKLNISEHIFFGGNYNNDLYKYASEKIGYNNSHYCNDGNKKIPIKIKKLPNNICKINKSSNQERFNFKSSFLLSILLIGISMSLIAFHYYWFSRNPNLFNELSR